MKRAVSSEFTLFAILCLILDWNPICISEQIKIQEWENPFQKLRVEWVKMHEYICESILGQVVQN